MAANRRVLKQRARELRKSMTDAERELWRWVRRKRFSGVQFYRQRPIGNYIVDFLAPSASLVVEVDGSHHYFGAQAEYDARRDEYFRSLGYRVLRFSDREILMETRSVLEAISLAIESFEHDGAGR